MKLLLPSVLALLSCAIASPVPSLRDAPSIKLHVTYKRKNMFLHGHSEFNIFATPVFYNNASKVLYDSYATFIDDDETHVYTVFHGSAFLTTTDASNSKMTQCLSSSMIPFDEILQALNDATPIPSASIGNALVKCPSTNLFKTTFAGTHYALCAFGKAGFTAYSSDMDISVEYLDRHITVFKPAFNKTTISCESVEKPTTLTPIALALATGHDMPSSVSRRLKPEAHLVMEASSCETCNTTPRPCMFLHGLGNSVDRDTVQDSPHLIPLKLGDMRDHAPCCSVVKYAVVESLDAGWMNETLQQKFCNLALSMSDTSDLDAGIIDNTIIVTHSMGGLVMATAIANNKCSISDTTSWVSSSPPMMGSMASDYLIDVCDKDKHIDIKVDILDMFDQCPVPNSRRSTIYEGEQYSDLTTNVAYVAAQKVYRENVVAAMCSDSYYGLMSIYHAPSILAAKLINHKSKENDGLVEFESCLGGMSADKFKDHYRNQFYRPRLNHADTAFLTGDSSYRSMQKPRKWFECLNYEVPRKKNIF